MGNKEAKFWADSIADECIQRAEDDPKLKEIVKKKGYICYDEKTPSGRIHVGSGRGWIIHDAIAKALRDKGVKARFILSSDDMDPLDKMPNYLDREKYGKFMGVPFRDIPSPAGKGTFAKHYFFECTALFDEFGIEAELESTGQRYVDGDFNWAIRKVLDNADKIKEIFENLYDQPYDKLPFNVRCPECGKISTTKVLEWDPDKEQVKFRCEKEMVDWAEGCGHEGWISPYDGNGKLPWKVEWAAKWPVVGVVCELAGKDHFTKGGSRTVSIQISDKVFDFPPPYPSTRKNIGKGYEFFTVGGKKMSTSKGHGIGFADIKDFIPPNLMRYLLVATRPRAMIDFNPEGKNDVVLLFERYDRTERIYYGKETVSNESEDMQHKRIYELSHVGKIRDSMPVQIPFSFAAVIMQVTLDADKAVEKLREMGHIGSKASGEDIYHVKDRLEYAHRWVKELAPEGFRFEFNEDIPEDLELSEEQLSALHALKDALKLKRWKEDELYEEFYNICENCGVKPGKFFQAAYRVLIGREKGPRLASFILTLGQEDVAELLEKL
ncbi:lysine--tRNA ligase [Candidatus Woesearchaeota archaeon]|nr:lysine--tRNA ligase [Candidatus Woesearchaeota archaeon]